MLAILAFRRNKRLRTDEKRFHSDDKRLVFATVQDLANTRTLQPIDWDYVDHIAEIQPASRKNIASYREAMTSTYMFTYLRPGPEMPEPGGPGPTMN